MTLNTLFSILKGGPSSGNIGHAGRPGKRGGSAPSRINAIISNLMASGISSSIDYPGIDKALRKVFEEKGFTGLPTLVENLIPEKGDTPIFRGVEGDHFIEQFKKGELFIGEGTIGSGSYFSNDRERAWSYGKGDNMIEAILPKSAKVIDWEDLRKLKNKSPIEIKIDKMTDKAFKLYDEGHEEEANRLQRQASKFRNESIEKIHTSKIFDTEPSLLAASLGYDAVRKKRSETENYYLILNRSILQVKE